MHTHICTHCGRTYEARIRQRKFCSVACRDAAWMGEGSPIWKGGRTVDPRGYVFVTVPGHPRKRVMEHRLLMERHLGRPLAQGEVVHHLDGNPSNNVIENLVLIPNNGLHRMGHGAPRSKTDKECSRCHVTKPREEFPLKYRDSGEPHQCWCKACMKEYGRERRPPPTRVPTHRDETTKQCAKCGETKPRTEFQKRPHPGARDPHRCRCRTCDAADRRERYARKHGMS